MGDKHNSEFNFSHESLYSELRKVRAENYYLKRQLKRERKSNKNQSKLVDMMNHKLRRYERKRRKNVLKDI